MSCDPFTTGVGWRTIVITSWPMIFPSGPAEPTTVNEATTMRIGHPSLLAVVIGSLPLVALVALVAAASADPIAPSRIAEQLVGGWSLVSRETSTADGKPLSDPGLSATPRGVLIYDRSGHVAAQLSRPGRTVEMLGDECRDAENVKGTNDTAQTILGYDAYFGTYTLDAQAGIVTHHLDSALYPGDIGKDIQREFTISGDTLTIRFHTTLRDGTRVVRTLVWARMK